MINYMNKIKSLLSCVMAICIFTLCAIIVSAKEDVNIDINKTSFDAEQTIVVTVNIPGGSLYNGAEVIIEYPSDIFEYEKTVTSDLYNNAFMNSLSENEGKVSVMMIYTSNIADGGTFAEFHLTPKVDVENSAVVEVKANVTDDSLHKYTFEKDFNIDLNIDHNEDEEESIPSPSPSSSAGTPITPTKRPSSGGTTGGAGLSPAPTLSPTPAPTSTHKPTKEPEPESTPLPNVEQSISFSDINGHWAEESIKRLSVQGLVNGFEDGTFHPDDTVTRAQFVKMIISALGNDMEEVVEQTFSDVSTEAWYAPYVEMAYKYGIIAGDGVYFYPDNNITRQEMAVMTARAFGIESGSDITFNDGDSIADWAVESVKAISGAGIMGGYEDNTFRPEDNTTRAQAAAVIDRILN